MHPSVASIPSYSDVSAQPPSPVNARRWSSASTDVVDEERGSRARRPGRRRRSDRGGGRRVGCRTRSGPRPAVRSRRPSPSGGPTRAGTARRRAGDSRRGHRRHPVPARLDELLGAVHQRDVRVPQQVAHRGRVVGADHRLVAVPDVGPRQVAVDFGAARCRRPGSRSRPRSASSIPGTPPARPRPSSLVPTATSTTVNPAQGDVMLHHRCWAAARSWGSTSSAASVTTPSESSGTAGEMIDVPCAGVDVLLDRAPPPPSACRPARSGRASRPDLSPYGAAQERPRPPPGPGRRRGGSSSRGRAPTRTRRDHARPPRPRR